MTRAMLIGCLSIVHFTSPTWAQDSLPPLLRGVRIEQHLNEQVPVDLGFRDESGQPVHLADFFQDKPVILVLAYYRCPRLCSEVLNGLLDGLRAVPLNAGAKFNVVVVSFDPREGADLAAAKKRNYIENYGRPGTDDGWHFLTGDQESIDRLTEAVGFYYNYDPKSDQFAHASGITVLTPQGKIARYFFGIKFSPRDLRLGLVEASEEKIGSPVDQLLLFCFHYDPASGQYAPAVLNLVRLAGVLTVLGLSLFLALMWRRERRKTAETNVVTLSAAKGLAWGGRPDSSLRSE
jgi:protein SCO1/2